MFAVTSLICVPPVVYVTFRFGSRNWGRRVVGWDRAAGYSLCSYLRAKRLD